MSESEYSKRRAELVDKLLGELRTEFRIACGRGCVYCCYGVTLWIKRAEAVLLINFLNSLPLKERKALWRKIKDYAKLYEEEARRVGYTPSSPLREEDLDTDRLGVIGGLHMNEVPCPFLDTERGECLVYEARPDMCRLMLFEDREVCRRDWENPLSFVWQREIAPFLERVKSRFYPRWNMERAKLGREFPRVKTERLEEEVGFITHLIKFDPVKKVFKLTG
ncbi:YkgJ family cysteine cluster protein [Hydrogenivirga sp.]